MAEPPAQSRYEHNPPLPIAPARRQRVRAARARPATAQPPPERPAERLCGDDCGALMYEARVHCCHSCSAHPSSGHRHPHHPPQSRLDLVLCEARGGPPPPGGRPGGGATGEGGGEAREDSAGGVTARRDAAARRVAAESDHVEPDSAELPTAAKLPAAAPAASAAVARGYCSAQPVRTAASDASARPCYPPPPPPPPPSPPLPPPRLL